MPDIFWPAAGFLLLIVMLIALILWAVRHDSAPRVPPPSEADTYIDALDLDKNDPDP